MNNPIRITLLALALLGTIPALAQEDISGVWAGQLQVAPDTSIAVHFTLSQENGQWTAVLDSPDMGAIKDVAASSVSFDGTQLAIEVASLSGSYAGRLDGGNFVGEWSQPGSTIPMQLAPYTASVLSDEAVASLLGSWHGKLMAPGVSFNIVFSFSRNEAGEFVGSLTNVDAGNQQVPISDISLQGDAFMFRVPQAQAEYRGTLEGDSITGQLKQGAQEMELNVSRGEYVAEQPQLDLSDADYELLAGRWSGQLGPLTIVLRVERDDAGTVVAFIDSPTQGANGLRVTSASLVDGELEAVLSVPPASFTGTLGDGVIDGNWNQGGMSNPLQLKRE